MGQRLMNEKEGKKSLKVREKNEKEGKKSVQFNSPCCWQAKMKK